MRVNTLVSNVPGPPVPLYMCGAKVTGIFPSSVILEGMGLNITVLQLPRPHRLRLPRRSRPRARPVGASPSGVPRGARRAARRPSGLGRPHRPSSDPVGAKVVAQGTAEEHRTAKAKAMPLPPRESFNLSELFETGRRRRPPTGSRSRRPARRAHLRRARRAGQPAGPPPGVTPGVGAGDHVGLQLLNGTEYLEGMLAAFKLRAVPVNVNYRYVERRARAPLRRRRPRRPGRPPPVRRPASPRSRPAVADAAPRRRGRGRHRGAAWPRRRVDYEAALAARRRRPRLRRPQRRRPLHRLHRRHHRACPRASCGATRTSSSPPSAAATRRSTRARSPTPTSCPSGVPDFPMAQLVRPAADARERPLGGVHHVLRRRQGRAARPRALRPGDEVWGRRAPSSVQHRDRRRRRHGPSAARRTSTADPTPRHVVAVRLRVRRRDPLAADEGPDRRAAAERDRHRRLRLLRDRHWPARGRRRRRHRRAPASASTSAPPCSTTISARSCPAPAWSAGWPARATSRSATTRTRPRRRATFVERRRRALGAPRRHGHRRRRRHRRAARSGLGLASTPAARRCSPRRSRPS